MSEVELPEDAQPGHRTGPWERAYLANKQRRTAEAQQQIDDARAEPTVAERSAYIDAMKEVDVQADAAVKELRDAPTAFRGIDPTPPDTLTLSGARLAAYRQLESAATAAHEAQLAMTTTGVALRDAIQAMCAAMTGVK